LVKIHWRMLILVFTRMLRSKNLTRWHWPLTLKINRVPDSPKDYVQHAQRDLARNHSGPTSVKSRKSRCLHHEMSEKNRTRWFTIKRRQNTGIDD
jgi:hypothetical protein